MFKYLVNKYKQHKQKGLINKVAKNYFRYVEEDLWQLYHNRNVGWYAYGRPHIWGSSSKSLDVENPALLILGMSETFLDQEERYYQLATKPHKIIQGTSTGYQVAYNNYVINSVSQNKTP